MSKRWAAGVALAVMAGVTAGYAVRPLPEKVQHWFAGTSSVERWGGLRLTVRLPDSPSPRTFELPKLDERAAALALELVLDPLAFRALPEDGSPLYGEALARLDEPAASFDLEQWSDQLGARHRLPVLRGREPAELMARASEAAAGDPRLADALLGYQYVMPLEQGDARTWEVFALGAIQLERSAVAAARQIADPLTGAPQLELTLSRDGAARFCTFSEQLTGHKLAMVTGRRVWSAPILNGPVCGGRLTMSMLDEDPVSPVAALAAVLALPALPEGTTVISHQLFPERPLGGQAWLARLLLGALAGLSAGLATWLVLALGRPSGPRAAPAARGPFPWRRLTFTAAAFGCPLALVYVPLPGISVPADDGPMIGLSLGMLGLTPLIASFVLVELVAAAVPSLRARRHHAGHRAPLTRAAVALAMGLAAAQGYFLARYFETLELGDAGWRFRLTTMLSLAAVTALEAWIAGLASARGLGNGYGAMLAGVAAVALWAAGVEPLAWPRLLPDLLALAGIAALTAGVLRWQTTSEGRAPLQAPVAGDAPISSLPGLVTALALGISVRLLEPATPLYRALLEREAAPLWALAFGLLSTPLWAWLWARPSLLASHARLARLSPPSPLDWRRAVLVSTGFSAALALLLLALSSPPLLLEGAVASYVTAIFLDLIADARAHRRALVPVALVHQVQRAALLEEALQRAGIPCHLQSRHLRALLAFFAPFAPITVLVSEEQAASAQQLLAGMEERLELARAAAS